VRETRGERRTGSIERQLFEHACREAMVVHVANRCARESGGGGGGAEERHVAVGLRRVAALYRRVADQREDGRPIDRAREREAPNEPVDLVREHREWRVVTADDVVACAEREAKRQVLLVCVLHQRCARRVREIVRLGRHRHCAADTRVAWLEREVCSAGVPDLLPST
jgi:hypothetical protein